MATLIPGGGNPKPILFIIGERPGQEEYYEGVPFVGPAGQELWSRLERITGLTRDDCYVTNLVKTFSPKPPSVEEIARDASGLRAELMKVRPSLIVTIGTHAGRWLLPQFEGVGIEAWHGLPHLVQLGHLRPFNALVIPVVHAAAALRQPGLYQNMFTNGLRAVKQHLRGRLPWHQPRTLDTNEVGLATIIAHAAEAEATGLDTEGTLVSPECITLSASDIYASLTNLTNCDGVARAGRLAFTQMALDKAKRIAIHYAVGDVKILHRLGLTLDYRKLDCTMLMAYYLELPQALKTLDYRLFGWQRPSFDDLIQPLDDALVRRILGDVYAQESERVQRYEAEVRTWKADTRAAKKARLKARAERRRARRAGRGRQRGRHRQLALAGVTAPVLRSRGDDRRAHGAGRGDGLPHRGPDDVSREAAAVDAPVADPPAPPSFPKRALGSLNKLLSTTTDTPLRSRWASSTFSPHVALPPPPTWQSLPQADGVGYALADAVAHRQTRDTLWPQLVAKGLDRAYRIDMAELPMIIRNEEIGLACDEQALRDLSKQFQREFADVLTRLEAVVGHPVNVNSQPQVADTLFKELGVRPTKKSRKTNQFTTADKYLKARRGEHAAVSLVLAGRQLSKYIGTYTETLPDMLQRPAKWHPHYLTRHWRRAYRETKRYFPDWKYTRTATGRRAETVILLIPKHDPTAKAEGRPNRAKQIRNCFHATVGHTLVSVDLSQIELRVMADQSQDKRMLNAFLSGVDYHAQVASDLLGAPRKKELQDESAHRLPAKTINFGIINGMTEYGMLDQLHEAGQLHWTIEAIQDLLDEWFRVHSGVEAMFRRQAEHGRDYGYVKDMFGARRSITAIWSEDERIAKEAERQALFPIQAGADRISKIWGRKIWQQVIQPRWKRGEYCEPWVRVHDDTTLETDTSIADDVQREMLALVPDLLSVPTLAEGKQGVQWGELH